MNAISKTLSLLMIFAFVGFSPSGARAADEAGEKIYKKYCSVCHSVESGRNKIGPSLAGLIGRKSASAERFEYSEPLRSLQAVWTPDVLDRWLTNPGAMVPGTRMLFPGLANGDDRAKLISYLGTLTDP